MCWWPAYDSKNYGDVPYLESIAVWNEAERTLTLFAVNRSLTQEIQLVCNLGNFEKLTLMEHIKLSGYDMATNTSAPESIVPSAVICRKEYDKQFSATLPPASWNVFRFQA